ncbi:DUF5615 family PIN-like protein [Roseofilum capinflatum]|uniref:DUF5615 family PIN-like protein n=1 Tax=Roseofilum capinflatum BLCC-M114 TaxID=3022440 RepID=A0ABT7B0L1_9CYAN|nr:DUF5615 family PIN-like protein [Roseofilum capinflatum]MDJ1172709.1 DUF5615 family PIN-like protein [Roseofilum capinflatum BLCC-M114]
MLKFYSNENFPLAMVDLMRGMSYDVLTSYEAGQANRKIPDNVVLEYATCAGRIVITENRQDFLNLHSTTSNHAGIIICKADRDYTGKVQALHDFFAQDTHPMANRLLRVMKQNRKGNQQTFIVREYSKLQN